MTIQAPTQLASDLVGSFRTFGDYGPVYQVVRAVNERTVHVLVVQTGEEIDYPADQAFDDPLAK